MRYVLGPQFGPYTQAEDAPTPPPPPPALADVIPTVGTVDANGVQIVVPAFDPATQVVPVEYRAYFVPTGSALPGDAQAFVDSPFTHSRLDGLTAAGVAVVPIPALSKGDYVGCTVFGFAA